MAVRRRDRDRRDASGNSDGGLFRCRRARGDRTEPVAANAADPHSTAELAAAADQIKAHLKTAPDDLKGWTLLGRTLASLGRFSEARDAYNHAIALAPDNAALHAEFGEVLVLEAQGKVTPGAEAEFAKAPDDPRSRYYAAEAALQQWRSR